MQLPATPITVGITKSSSQLGHQITFVGTNIYNKRQHNPRWLDRLRGSPLYNTPRDLDKVLSRLVTRSSISPRVGAE